MEIDFRLDPRLANDCIPLGELGSGNLLLLHRNAVVAWFIIVPQTAKTEFFELSGAEQQSLLAQVNQLSSYIKERFNSDKLNIATIGNVVSQLHIHVIGRSQGDPYWPGVVWGEAAGRSYAAEEVEAITRDLRQKLGVTP